ncbi:isocitrate dehydrogenase [NAD] subunit gamma, mitochondrial isoform X2 [Octopus sinensis]|uniref:Isocitrate dehydrogenase [NAD] subunit, mitochondrial n=1 Tax=Octopus sinensis TaxID=2607531 RepID=A0A6P7TQZ3_9MOLL|nr:isocitrate dehydrogenase [NAD] subunit gamma, mitochondrial isoform X2 [Octopus sinensis]
MSVCHFVSNNCLTVLSRLGRRCILNGTVASRTSQHKPLLSQAYATSAAKERSQYGGRYTVTLFSGDGIGPELLDHVKTVFRFAGAPIDFEEITINARTSEQTDMENALLSVKRNGVAIKGNIETAMADPSKRSINVSLRTELDLWASIVQCKTIPGISVRHQGIDVVIIRENTEGEYSNLEHENVNGVVESLKIITRKRCMNIAKYAFDYAVKHGRKKVTAIHKANIMKLGDGLFLECCKNVAEEYPQIEFNNMIVDNACMQMVSHPQQFDVLVLPNLYGNILSNVATGMVGGAGVVPGRNIGDSYAIFETGTRNSGRSIQGKNIANPTGMLLASCDMLDYLGCYRYATMIRESVMNVLISKKIHTPDVGGTSSTSEVIEAILDDLRPKASSWLF